MKKYYFPLITFGALATNVYAQSNVTVFGVVDIGYRHVDNAGVSAQQMASGANAPSRIGFRGVEDLGGGLQANFVLDAAINADTGAGDPSRLFGRRSTVSLVGPLGEVRLGRDRLPTWTPYVESDTSEALGVSDSSRIYPVLGGVTTKIRGDNGVAYFTPSGLGGFYAHVSLAPGENLDGTRYAGARVGYKKASLDVTGAYGQTKTVGNAFNTLVILAASYDFKLVKMFAAVQKVTWTTQENRMYLLGAKIPFGQDELRLQYARSDGRKSISDRDADFFAIGYVHPLSKRTAIYAALARTSNKGSANYTTADIAGVTMAAGEKSTGFDLGLRHRF